MKFFLLYLFIFSQTVLAVPAASFKVETVLQNLDHPWAIAFLDQNQALVTERSGKLYRVQLDKKTKQEITGVPKVVAKGQGGLLDVLLDVDFKKNKFVFLSFSQADGKNNRTAVARAVLNSNKLEQVKIIWHQNQSYNSDLHFGSRLVMDQQGNLFVTMGERFTERDKAQDLKSHLGKIVRITREGKPVSGNPFQKGPALPDIWSYGHRNVQGALLHPVTQELWIHEHGPMGGDEINIVRAGKNYGWPIVTYGLEYSGAKMGEGSEKPGMESPIYQWTPSIAPSGMSFYTADVFPQWKGNLFVGSLKFQSLYRLEMDGEKVKNVEKLLVERKARIRDVRQSPDGFLYVLTDEDKGELLRLSSGFSGRND